jgi:hypothetical protein
LRHVDLSHARCPGASFDRGAIESCDLSNCNLSSANLQWSLLINCNLRWANLDGAKLVGCIYDRDTVWPQHYSPAAHGAIAGEYWDGGPTDARETVR